MVDGQSAGERKTVIQTCSHRDQATGVRRQKVASGITNTQKRAEGGQGWFLMEPNVLISKAGEKKHSFLLSPPGFQ